MKLRALLPALLFLPGCAFAQSAPLDRAEILGRLAQDYSPSYIAHLVKIRGVSFSSSEASGSEKERGCSEAPLPGKQRSQIRRR
jgi:hypothetical protein